jgi:plasmid rolling circle replication initiator protein Rep
MELFPVSCFITGIKKEPLARWVVKKVKKVQDLSHALNVERTEDGFELNTTSDRFAVAVSECAQYLSRTVNALARGSTT